MATGRGANGPSKKDKREAAREHARIMREEAAKKARRRKWWIQGSVAVVIVAVLAVVALVIVNSIPQGQTATGPKNMISNGIVFTSSTKAVRTPALQKGESPVPTAQPNPSKVAYITIYEDLQCPYCQQFEQTNMAQIQQWLDAGLAQLEIHPLNYLTSAGNGGYSLRAGNAVACVADYQPDKFLAVNSALYAKQPKENSGGLPNSEILSILKSAGASSSNITTCVNNVRYTNWLNNATELAATKALPNSNGAKMNGTPTVLVNGQEYQGSLTDTTTFASFVQSQVVASSTSTPTPTPTPTK